MTDNRVVVRYESDVARAPGVRRRFAGQQFVVTDAATAEQVHPQATVVAYADGRKFVKAQDASLIASDEKEGKAAEREAAKEARKAEREAAKAAREEAKADREAESEVTGQPEVEG